MICDDVLSQLLDDELESEVTFAQRMSSSPPQATPLTLSLTPLRKAHRAPAAEGAFPLKPAAIVLSKSSLSEMSPPSAAREDSSRSESTPTHHHIYTSHITSHHITSSHHHIITSHTITSSHHHTITSSHSRFDVSLLSLSVSATTCVTRGSREDQSSLSATM